MIRNIHFQNSLLEDNATIIRVLELRSAVACQRYGIETLPWSQSQSGLAKFLFSFRVFHVFERVSRSFAELDGTTYVGSSRIIFPPAIVEAQLKGYGRLFSARTEPPLPRDQASFEGLDDAPANSLAATRESQGFGLSSLW